MPLPPVPAIPNPAVLLEKLLKAKMPYGKYQGRPLLELPEAYVVWFRREGFPKGELGQMMGLLYEIQVNGLESLVTARALSEFKSRT